MAGEAGPRAVRGSRSAKIVAEGVEQRRVALVPFADLAELDAR
jgi:hypothetical protein